MKFDNTLLLDTIENFEDVITKIIFTNNIVYFNTLKNYIFYIEFKNTCNYIILHNEIR